MDALIKAKLQVGDRVVAFHQDHPPMNAGMQAAVTNLEAALAEARRLDQLYRSGKATAGASVVTKADLRVTIRDGISLLVGLAESARAIRKDIRITLRQPYLKADAEKFVNDSREALVVARGVEDVLTGFGLPEGLLDAIDAALTQLTARAKEKELGRNMQVGATVGIDRATAEVMRLLRQLDRLNRFRYKNDPEALTAWRRARNLPYPTRREDRAKALPKTIGGSETKAS